MLEIKGNSPSNIETGWRQKYFYHLESDSMLDRFIKIFQRHGNDWNLKKELFDKIVAEQELSKDYIFQRVYDQTLDVDGDFIHLNETVAHRLLSSNWQPSPRNFIKTLKRWLRF